MQLGQGAGVTPMDCRLTDEIQRKCDVARSTACCIEQRFLAAVVILRLSVVDTVYTAPRRPSELTGGAGKGRALRAPSPSRAPVKTGTESDWDPRQKALLYTPVCLPLTCRFTHSPAWTRLTGVWAPFTEVPCDHS